MSSFNFSCTKYNMSNACKLDIDKKQQKKRHRSVKNGIIEIDDIDEGPGINFYNWIRITKLKLAVKIYQSLSRKHNIIKHMCIHNLHFKCPRRENQN